MLSPTSTGWARRPDRHRRGHRPEMPFAVRGAHRLGLDIAGFDDVAGDPERGTFQRHRTCESDETGFAGRIVAMVGPGHMRAGDRAREHDASVALPAHGRKAGLHRQERTFQVHRERPVPVGLVQRLDRTSRADAGDVRQHVDPPEPVDRSCGQRLHVGLPRGVGVHVGGTVASGHRGTGLVVDVGQHDARTFAGEHLDDPGAHTLGTADDDRDLAIEATRHALPPAAVRRR